MPIHFLLQKIQQSYIAFFFIASIIDPKLDGIFASWTDKVIKESSFAMKANDGIVWLPYGSSIAFQIA